MNKQLAFYFDSSACSGCKTCQVACRDKHDLGKGMLWRRVYEVAGGDWRREGQAWVPDIYSYYISMACNHCLDPICMNSCPNNAIYRNDDGLVLIDEKRCMGCRYCEWTCPYGALHYDDEKGVMTKCTMCADYIEQGKPPACVSACPMRVLEVGELYEYRGRLLEPPSMYPLPDPGITNPALVVKPHKDSLRAEREKLRINNREEVKDDG
ncbi:MAG: DMSO/selenate family reductase complex B subunit [Bacteroidales bacterium]